MQPATYPTAMLTGAKTYMGAPKIAHNYLVYGKKSCSDDDCFSDLDAELISKFRCLNDVEKGKIIERMDIMLENSVENRKED